MNISITAFRTERVDDVQFCIPAVSFSVPQDDSPLFAFIFYDHDINDTLVESGVETKEDHSLLVVPGLTARYSLYCFLGTGGSDSWSWESNYEPKIKVDSSGEDN